MNKRGQSTLFIILGVVIVIIIGVYALIGYGIINKRFTFAQDLAEKQDDINEYVRECLKNVIKQKLKEIGLENLNINDLINDPDIKNCFNLDNFKDGFEIITANVPDINYDVINNNLDFGVIYPVTISKNDINATLFDFNFIQHLKTCGIDFSSIDERLRIRSTIESCVNLVGIGSNFLLPIYNVKTPLNSKTVLNFDNPSQEATIIKQIDETTWRAIPNEVISTTQPIYTRLGITRTNEIIRSLVDSGNYSLGLCNIFGIPSCPTYKPSIPKPTPEIPPSIQPGQTITTQLIQTTSTQPIEICGINLHSIDDRAKLTSNMESCISLVGIGPNYLLAPIYSVETVAGTETILSFGNPIEGTKEVTIVKQISETEFISIESEIIPTTDPIPTIIRTQTGEITLIQSDEVIRAVIGPGNYSLGLCSLYGCPFYAPQVPVAPGTPQIPPGQLPEEEEQGGGGGDSGCFLEGTQILMADGTTKSIQDIKEGDFVLSYDEFNEKYIEGKVTKKFIHENETRTYLLINRKLRVTPNHPMLINNKWAKISEAKIGDSLMNSNGDSVLIESIEEYSLNSLVYNLEIDKWHTYLTENYLVSSGMGYGIFSEGLKITMADGSYKNIENIKVGDKVLSYDIKNKKYVVGTVIRIFSDKANGYYLINGKIKTRISELFFQKGEWITAENLENAQRVEELIILYGFGVKDWENYFIEGMLVHNQGK